MSSLLRAHDHVHSPLRSWAAREVAHHEQEARRVRHLNALYQAECVLADRAPALSHTAEITRQIVETYLHVMEGGAR